MKNFNTYFMKELADSLMLSAEEKKFFIVLGNILDTMKEETRLEFTQEFFQIPNWEFEFCVNGDRGGTITIKKYDSEKNAIYDFTMFFVKYEIYQIYTKSEHWEFAQWAASEFGLYCNVDR